MGEGEYNRIKNSRLMMEFREIDSYLTSDSSSDEEGNSRPRLAQTELDNSLLRMGRELLAAAKSNPISVPQAPPDAEDGSNPTLIPNVTLRLTRLDPSLKDDSGADPDPRIEQTIQCLRDMGLDVQLGGRSRPSTAHPSGIQAGKGAPSAEKKVKEKANPFKPTPTINLDLSALIALISDITHSPLPTTEEEAYARFVPPQRYLEWKKERVRSLARQAQNTPVDRISNHVGDGESWDEEERSTGTWEDSGQHSRALAAQAIQEMQRGMLQDMHDRLVAVSTSNSGNDPSLTSGSGSPNHLATVQFWTTDEARRRCLQIVSKIGGRREKRRADALLRSGVCSQVDPMAAPASVPSSQPQLQLTSDSGAGGEEAYWEDSRYPVGFLPLIPIRVFSSITTVLGDEEASGTRSPFFSALVSTCSGILSRDGVPVPTSAATNSVSEPTTTATTTPKDHDDNGPSPLYPPNLPEIPPATLTSLPKLTSHTLSSMLAGAERGWTTLTTNRSSVRTVMKEMRRGFGRGFGVEGTWWEGTDGEEGKEDREVRMERAALWIVDPRSLAEGMRSDIADA
ncbi:hypothetical protein HYDPIDRAFT_113103 [Hydnomerulius pinastri MD-312]|uniref:Uncharacterized protein n=1 Tax=Hydnomerulius pinastri MD-312 TaxID=994086 RepID=A0A0C9WES6_9AGAM|nr:hypothetical protein HYDPIDRAFT_113103 [Hydnomerulius pinastri MD-312]